MNQIWNGITHDKTSTQKRKCDQGSKNQNKPWFIFMDLFRFHITEKELTHKNNQRNVKRIKQSCN